MSGTLLIAFAVLALLGVPLSLSLGIASAATLYLNGLPLSMITQTMGHRSTASS